MTGVLCRGSLKGAPQNLQNCAVGSLLPRHRAQTRGGSGGAAGGGRRFTTGEGAMGSSDAAGGGGGGESGGGAEGMTAGAVRGLATAGSPGGREGIAATALPQETQKRVPRSFGAPHRGQRRAVAGPSRFAAGRGSWAG
jgi:hypothetical protein